MRTVPQFLSDDSIPIFYEQWNTEAAGPPVVLHHGFVADHAVNWVAPGVVDALTGAGRRVVALDARGHGRSGKPHDPAFYGERRMARDVSLLVDLLGVGEFDLVGYSMGAIVSLLVASGGEKRLRRLAVGGVGRGVVRFGGVDTSALPTDRLIAALRAPDPSSITDPESAGFRMFADALGADREALAAQAQVVHAEPIPLGAIAVPALVFAGDADPLAAEPGELAGAIPGARLEVFAGDHLTVLRDPPLIPELVRFLAG